jgi:hypothetical protein
MADVPVKYEKNNTPLTVYDTNNVVPLGHRALQADQIRDPWSAFLFGISSRANIRAYQVEISRLRTINELVQSQVELNKTIQKAYETDTALAAWRELAPLFLQNEIHRHLDAFEEEKHKRVVAVFRREKEQLEAHNQALQAKHSLEATERFKEIKFNLGEARARARQNDAEVDSKTAEAAVVKIAGELSKLIKKQSPDVEGWLDLQIAQAQEAIEEAEADGRDTEQARAELNMLLRLKNLAGGTHVSE